MKKLALIGILVFQKILLFSAECAFYAGPHFNYTQVDFNTPSRVEGYMGGVTAGGEYRWKRLFTSLDFEGYWNAGRITGRPCERSSLREYFVEWKVGGNFCPFGQCFFPYIGFGWDRFKNKQNPQGVGLAYTYKTLCIPIGFYAYGILHQCFRCGIQFEWRPDVRSRVDVASLSFRAKLEHAFRVQLPLEISYSWSCSCIHLDLIPFYDWNRFGKVKDPTSNGINVNIPDLTRWYAGIRVLLGYSF